MSNSKTLAPLNIFSCSWTFWKACNELFNFHVDHFSWIKIDLGDKWPWSWQKKVLKTLRNFSKCLEKIQILTFVDFFWYSWFLMIKLNNLKCLDDEKFWFPKLTKKSQSLTLSGRLTFCLMIQNFHYQSIMVLEMSWAKKLGQDDVLEPLRSCPKPLGHALNQKSMVHFLQSKP